MNEKPSLTRPAYAEILECLKFLYLDYRVRIGINDKDYDNFKKLVIQNIGKFIDAIDKAYRAK